MIKPDLILFVSSEMVFLYIQMYDILLFSPWRVLILVVSKSRDFCLFLSSHKIPSTFDYIIWN